MIWIKGKQYNGQFLNGKMHGYGVFSWPSGQTYRGEYKDNKKHGKGEMEWGNGVKFIGTWQNGFKSGEGIVVDQNGVKKKVHCENDKIMDSQLLQESKQEEFGVRETSSP